MEDSYLQKEIENIISKLDYSWKLFVISNFDEAVDALNGAVDEINDIADYSLKNKMEVNLESKKISYLLKKINNCLKNSQFVEAADILKYKLIKNLQAATKKS